MKKNLLTILVVLTAFFMTDLAMGQFDRTNRISMYVKAENGHPANTIYLGCPAYIYVSVRGEGYLANFDDPLQYVFMGVSFSNLSGTNSLIEPVTKEDWIILLPEFDQSYNSFNEYFDDLSPDSLATTLWVSPEYSGSRVEIAKFLVRPTALGTLRIDTASIKISNDPTPTLFLLQSRVVTVRDVLDFSFPDIEIIAGPSDDDDGDGYLNQCDNCPTHYNPDQEDINGNGVGDVCETGVKGDLNCDGGCNVGDAVYLINYVFKGGPPPCQ